MEKKNNGLIIILVIIILGLGCYIIYDKNVLGLKDEKKESNITTVNDNSSKKDAGIEIGSVGNKETKINFEGYENSDLYFIIKDGKVVFHSPDGSEVVDSTIPDKVVQIAKGFSCAGNDARLAALTEKGEVYYNKYETIKEVSKEKYDYSFDFIKVITEEKIYGIDAVQPNVFHTCSYKEFFAYVNKEDMKIIKTFVDPSVYSQNIVDIKVVSASLGQTYDELYPYEDYFIINLDMPFLYKMKDGRLYFKNTDIDKIANADMFLTGKSNYIYADKIYIRETNNKNEYKYYIVDKNKKLYIMNLLPISGNYFNYIYNIDETDKIVNNIKEEKQEGQMNKVTFEYADGTSEVI